MTQLTLYVILVLFVATYLAIFAVVSRSGSKRQRNIAPADLAALQRALKRKRGGP